MEHGSKNLKIVYIKFNKVYKEISRLLESILNAFLSEKTHPKSDFQGGGFLKNQYRGGVCLKRGLGQFADLKGDLTRKRGVDTPIHTMMSVFITLVNSKLIIY